MKKITGECFSFFLFVGRLLGLLVYIFIVGCNFVNSLFFCFRQMG